MPNDKDLDISQINNDQIKDEDKLEKIIAGTLWTILTSMATLGLPHVKAFFKK